MNSFLRECRRLIGDKTKRFCIVIGNESCDLDSAISSLSLAYYFNKNLSKISNSPHDVSHAIPIFNINREELPLKTEVIHYLKKIDLDYNSITFKDDVSESFIRNNDIVLVDHHFSKYSPIAVFDHRPLDTNANIPKECKMELELVGSCATLIANIILNDENVEEYKKLLEYLYAAIILDTVNFSKEAERAKEKDFDVSKRIESLLNISNVEMYRKEIFDELVCARADISTLDSYQILLKDMKLITSKLNESIKVALPGFPMLVQEYIKLENANENLKKFATIHECHVVVLIGMKIVGDSVERDIGVVNIKNNNLYDIINANLVESDNLLNLELYKNCEFSGGKFFKQNNIRASRKQILPLVKTIIDKIK